MSRPWRTPKRPPPSAFIRWPQLETTHGGKERADLTMLSVLRAPWQDPVYPLPNFRTVAAVSQETGRCFSLGLLQSRTQLPVPSRMPGGGGGCPRRAPCLPGRSALSSFCCSKATSLRQTSASRSLRPNRCVAEAGGRQDCLQTLHSPAQNANAASHSKNNKKVKMSTAELYQAGPF